MDSILAWLPSSILTVGVMVVLIMQTRATERIARVAIERLDNVTRILATVTAKVMMLKGLHPHHAASSEFTPSGMSWDTYKEMEAKQGQAPEAPTQGQDVGSDEQVAKQGWLQDMREYEQMLKQEEAYRQTAMQYGPAGAGVPPEMRQPGAPGVTMPHEGPIPPSTDVPVGPAGPPSDDDETITTQ